jgi:hypothetical protein
MLRIEPEGLSRRGPVAELDHDPVVRPVGNAESAQLRKEHEHGAVRPDLPWLAARDVVTAPSPMTQALRPPAAAALALVVLV